MGGRSVRALALAGALATAVAVGVAQPAEAATIRTVTTLAALTGELAGPPGAETVVLGADLVDAPATTARTADGSDLVLDLAGHGLALGSLRIGSGASLRITDSTTTGGTLVVDGAAVDTPVHVPAGAALTIDGTAHVSASGGRSSAVIGGHASPDPYGAGAVSILGRAVVDVRGSTTGGRSSSGIGGPRGSIHIGDEAVVTVSSTSAGAALGGGSGGIGGDSAVLIDGDARVTATSQNGGAAIGSAAGISAARLTTVTIGGRAVVVATAGAYGPGIGNGGASATRTAVTIGDDAVVTATGGTLAAGIGGGVGAAPGFTAGGDGADIVIGPRAQVTAAGGSSTDTAIGNGSGRAGAAFGSLRSAGRITVPAGAALRIPAGSAVDSSGTLVVAGTLTGAGTLRNTGTVAAVGAGTLDPATTITGDRFSVDLDPGAGTAVGPTALRLSTDTIAAGGTATVLPVPPAGQVGLGWSTTTGDDGVEVDDRTDLRTLTDPAPVGAARILLHARFAPREAAQPRLPTTDPAAAQRGAAYRASFAAGGIGAAAYGVVAGALPAGLRLDPATGLLSGTPSTAEDAGFTVAVTNRFGADTASYRLRVAEPPAPARGIPAATAAPETSTAAAPPQLPEQIGTGRQRIDPHGTTVLPLPAGAQYSVTAGALPAGLRLDPARSALVGTAARPGRYRFTIRATTAAGAAERRYALLVVAPLAVRIERPDAVAGGRLAVTVTGLLPRERFSVRIGGTEVARRVATRTRERVQVEVPRRVGAASLQVGADDHRAAATRGIRVLRAGAALDVSAPRDVQANRDLVVRVRGLAAGEPLRLRYDGRLVSPADARADRHGRYRLVISAGWAWGWKTIAVSGLPGRTGGARTAVGPRLD